MQSILHRYRHLALPAFLIVEVLLLLASIPYHELNGDEAWFAEEAYSMSRDGYSHSNLFKGFIREDERVVVQHKLFIYTGAVLFRFLGYHLFVFRLIPLLSCALLFFLFYRYLRCNYADEALLPMAASAVLLLIPQFFYFATIARPEMFVAVWGFGSFMALHSYLRTAKYSLLFVSAACAGFAMLSHLNGSIFIATACVLLLVHKRYMALPLFALCALLAFTPYLYDILQHQDIFRLQINSPLIASKTSMHWYSPFLHLLQEQKRLFHNADSIIPSVIFLVVIITQWRSFRAERDILFSYTLLLMLFMGLIIEDKSIKYSVYYAPFWAVLIARAYSKYAAQARAVRPAVRLASAFLLGCFCLYGLVAQAKGLRNKADYAALNSQIATLIPRQASCAAPMNFIFNELPNYCILSNYLVRYETQGSISIQSMADFCRKKQCQYLVFNKYGERIDDIQDYSNTALLQQYFRVISETAEYTVLQYRGE